VGKGANSIISMLHHLFEAHGMGECSVHLHADDCMRYLQCTDSVYDEKKEKQKKWDMKQSKLKEFEEARKKQESKP